ncbi:MAG: hypothetical protein KL785_09240 [Brevundimonas sp.]|nr:hypothetical protein [Brevundimonas sp.]
MAHAHRAAPGPGGPRRGVRTRRLLAGRGARAILDALKAHDPAGARRAMRCHFNRLLSAMLDASARTAMQELERQVAASRERFLISTLHD